MRLYIIPGPCSLAVRWPKLESYRAHMARRPHVIAAVESEA